MTPIKSKILIFALLTLSFSFFILGLILPVFQRELLGFKWDQISLLGGIFELYSSESYFLAIILTLFTVMFPFFKYTVLVILLTFRRKETTENLLSLIKNLGKWSMLDIFVIAILILSIELGGILKISIREGTIFFSLSVLTAMYLTHKVSRSNKDTESYLASD
ncbi:paraquat-inducible protein A [Bacteroidota bacterium]